jgi:hypothetical protein
MLPFIDMKAKLVLVLGAMIILTGMMLIAASIAGHRQSLTMMGVNFAMVNETVNVLAGSFSNVIHMKETSDLEPAAAAEENLHAPGVGQVIDGDTKLVSYGYLK